MIHFTAKAPELTDPEIARYIRYGRQIEDEETQFHFDLLVSLVMTYLRIPRAERSTGPITEHPCGGQIHPLRPEVIELLNPPMDAACNEIGRMFDSLSGDVRNAGFHLLWYARELNRGREPLTV